MADQTRFEYDAPILHLGPGCVEHLGTTIDRLGGTRALVVCGRTVGSNPSVIDPVRDGLGHRLAEVFAETTPAKRLATAVAARDRLEALDGDVIVGLGGGSSLDVAKTTVALASTDLTHEEAATSLVRDGSIPVGTDPPPLVVIPTTFAGADLSFGGGITVDPSTDPVERATGGGVSDPRLMPRAVFYDASLVATTPTSVLCGSAMNGYDKGIETIYAPSATPITDATAIHGLRLLTKHLPSLRDEGIEIDTYAAVLEGIVLCQYGIARPRARKLSIIHAFGHGVKATVRVQQGVAHAIMAPHVLRLVFDHVGARRDTLARALGVNSELEGDALAAEIVSVVEAVRDDLGLPARLRDIDGLERAHLEPIASRTAEDSLMANQPEGLELTEQDLLAILDAAW